MKKAILLSILVIISLQSTAQANKKTDDVKKSLQTENKDTVAWIYSDGLTIGVNEGFLHNWSAGGELASIAINGLFSGSLTHYHHNNVWTNTLNLAYGLNYAFSLGFIPHKTDDRIDFTSKYGTQVKNSKNMFLTGLLNFKSQFTKGYDYNQTVWDTTSTSKFMSPAYLTLAAGFEYRKGTNLNIFLSPLAARLILVDKYYTSRSVDGAYGVANGKTSAFQLGAYFTGTYAITINKKASFKTRLDLYMNYLAKDTKDSAGNVIKKDNPGNIDVYWDNLFAYQFNKRINMSIGLTMIYDNDIPYSGTYVDKTTGATVEKNEPGKGWGWWQVNQIFVFGLQYKF